MDKELKNLHFRRALIFQDIAIVEQAMNRLICLYFLKTPTDDQFTKELLQEQYFSFELRRRLFQTIFKKMYPECTFPWSSLQRMQELRNVIAHARMDEEIPAHDGQRMGSTRKPFYAYHTVEDEAGSLHDEFKGHMDKVMEALNAIKNDIKLSFMPEPIIEIS